jgi:dipeptidyl aminopeptidase/acylaminoacyl peptidase
MTQIDRIEARLPELLSELGAARVPDYFDDMLQQTSRARQRPAWSSLERWLPMGVIARPALVRLPAWRPILIVILLALLVAGGLLIYAGSRSVTLPPPFGPARNGVIVYATPDGDIATLDPATGATSIIIGGPTVDSEPVYTNMGDQILFARETSDGGTYNLARADGSNVREVIRAHKPIDWLNWTPNGDRFIYTLTPSAAGQTFIVDPAKGTTTALDFDVSTQGATWRPGHDEFVFYSTKNDVFGYYLAKGDGSTYRLIAQPDGAGDQFTLSPDGSSMVYMTWTDGQGEQGRLHLLDIDSGKDSLLTTLGDGYEWEGPQFSPDGTAILSERYVDTATGAYHLTLLPVAGGPAVEFGPEHAMGTSGAQKLFSPDGKSVLATYLEDNTTWLLDAAGGPGQRVSWPYTGGPAWQRLAP